MQTIGHLAQLAGASLISGIWQGFLLAIGVWLSLRLVPRTSASLRFAIWSAVLAVIALLPLFESYLRLQPSAGTSMTNALHIDARWSLAVIALWTIFSLYRAADLAIHALRLRAMLKRAIPVSDSTCAALLTDGHQHIELCTSYEIDRPSVIGFFAPRILIPTALFAQLTSAELKQIILHEVEHLRRRDDWLNLLQKLSLVLFPLNPILIWVERRLCLERELACDDGVLRRTRAPRAYATCLASLAERGLNRRTLSLALGALGISGPARQSELSRRIHRILRHDATLSPFAARALTAVISLGLAGGAAGLAHCPQLVTFVAAPSSQHFEANLPARFDLAPHTEQVVYRESQAPRATLLKAAYPDPRPATRNSKPFAAKPFAAKPSAVKKHRRIVTPEVERIAQNDLARRLVTQADDQAWVVLSSWTESTRPRLILPIVTSQTGQTSFTPRYAAVPTEAGWLIIQL